MEQPLFQKMVHLDHVEPLEDHHNDPPDATRSLSPPGFQYRPQQVHANKTAQIRC